MTVYWDLKGFWFERSLSLFKMTTLVTLLGKEKGSPTEMHTLREGEVHSMYP